MTTVAAKSSPTKTVFRSNLKLQGEFNGVAGGCQTRQKMMPFRRGIAGGATVILLEPSSARSRTDAWVDRGTIGRLRIGRPRGHSRVWHGLEVCLGRSLSSARADRRGRRVVRLRRHPRTARTIASDRARARRDGFVLVRRAPRGRAGG